MKVGFTSHAVFEVSVDKKVQEELNLSDDDILRLFNRPRYIKGWTQAKKETTKRKKSKPKQATVSKSDDEILF